MIRSSYHVAPGLYAVGSPGSQSPVLVTANYKLSFDALRFQLVGIDAWLLVLDTRGINVWCAAGKGTFSTEEVILSVKRFRVDEVVNHRELILPQLAAVGVAAHAIKAGCGFGVSFGPIRSEDLAGYLQQGCQCNESMREVTFTLAERAVLIPVELYLVARPLVITCALALVLSGVGPAWFTLQAAVDRGVMLLIGTILGLVSGAVLTPLLLPWLPFRQFWLKGLVTGLVAAALAWKLFAGQLVPAEQIALMLWVLTVSSYLAMNFTGSTPYTSPSGVEYEMRRGLPLQLITAALTLVLWLAGPFF